MMKTTVGLAATMNSHYPHRRRNWRQSPLRHWCPPRPLRLRRQRQPRPPPLRHQRRSLLWHPCRL